MSSSDLTGTFAMADTTQTVFVFLGEADDHTGTFSLSSPGVRTVQVQFTPPAVGLYSETVTFVEDDSEIVLATLVVQGQGGPPSLQGRYYYLTDHLGSVRATLDETGQVVQYDDYYPFGAPMPGRSGGNGEDGDPTGKPRYTGHEREWEQDEAVYYAGARYYDGLLGRWSVVDPLADEQFEISPYNYVLNNPLGLVDPDGQMPCPPCDGSLDNVLRQTFNWLGRAFDNLAGDLGLEQVQTSPPPVYKDWAAVRELAKAVGITATAVAGVASGASLMAGGSAALASTAATAGTVSTAAATTETVAATVDYALGGPSTPADIAVGFVSGIAIAGASSDVVTSTITRTADDVLAPTGLSATLDFSLQETRRVVRNFAKGSGAAVGGSAAALTAPSVFTTTNELLRPRPAANDAYQHLVPIPRKR